MKRTLCTGAKRYAYPFLLAAAALASTSLAEAHAYRSLNSTTGWIHNVTVTLLQTNAAGETYVDVKDAFGNPVSICNRTDSNWAKVHPSGDGADDMLRTLLAAHLSRRPISVTAAFEMGNSRQRHCFLKAVVMR